MIIIPSIDIIDGNCVRLIKGNYDHVTTYSRSPADMAKQFKSAGAKVLHVVDLQGAKQGTITQIQTIEKIVKAFDGLVQVGGGIRNKGDLNRLYSMGVSRVVVGTKAINHIASNWLDNVGADAIVMALDFRLVNTLPYVSTTGWTQTTSHTVWDVLDRIKSLKHVLCTDIGRDGMQQGPNIPFYRELVLRYPHVSVQASGGVSSLSDILTLASLGVNAAIIGKALYENTLDLTEAIRSC